MARWGVEGQGCQVSVKVVSWNVAQRSEPWRVLIDMDADIALLQEAGAPPPEIASQVDVDPAPWRTGGARNRPWRTAIAKLSDRVSVEWIEARPLEDARGGDFAVSRQGTLTAAVVSSPDVDPFVAISMYSLWTRPHASTGSKRIVSDASAHRVVSDLSAFIGSQKGHRILAAGDLNILHGHGEHGNRYWALRYGTVFERMKALGLPFIGPQHPHGRQANPWPRELPRGSANVPTYYSVQQGGPAAATRQLDFVFASRRLADSVSVRAINEPEQWGPSDHCRIGIEVS